MPFLAIAREAEARGGVSRIQGTIGFFVSGYGDDSRELFDIPAVRDYFHEVDRVAPFFLYYIADESQGPLVRLYVKMFLVDGDFFANPNAPETDTHLFQSFLFSRLDAVGTYCRAVSAKEGVRLDPETVAYHTMRCCGMDVSLQDVQEIWKGGRP